MESFLSPSREDQSNEQGRKVKKETQLQRKDPKGKGCRGAVKSSQTTSVCQADSRDRRQAGWTEGALAGVKQEGQCGQL